MENKKEKLKGGGMTTIQAKLSSIENLVLERFRYEFKIRDKREVLKKILRMFPELWEFKNKQNVRRNK